MTDARTHRRLTEPRLVIASHNRGKVAEIRALMAPFGIDVVSAGDLGLPEPEETGLTFIDNAVLKARASAEASGLPALADDSGMTVAALDGAPGIYSARWAGPSKDFGAAMELVRTRMGDNPDRSAAFVCALAIAWPDGHVETFEGVIGGHLEFPPRGDFGFGYDPIFVPEGDTRSFGEFPPEEKHRISHRARAFNNLVRACLDGDGGA
ncbi:RdgB/HAM1 family non-canonical purine NTP pyrophosphatase [Tistrella bauzanensis]|nr:RdgB/HAM1 family non-canonical purine NTP pyrophosphatase [Tistrella bauzanensis]